MCIDLTEHSIMGKSKSRHLGVKDKRKEFKLSMLQQEQQNAYVMSRYAQFCTQIYMLFSPVFNTALLLLIVMFSVQARASFNRFSGGSGSS